MGKEKKISDRQRNNDGNIEIVRTYPERIKNLKNRKASGSAKKPNKLIKYGGKTLSTPPETG